MALRLNAALVAGQVAEGTQSAVAFSIGACNRLLNGFAIQENTYPRPFGLDQLMGGQLAAMRLPLTGLGEPCDHLLICMSKRLIRATCLFGRWDRG